MEIEVGEYVRTISGNIDKVDALYGMVGNTIHLEKHKWQDIRNIVAHSKNIIDLIEVGDYVNGSEVLDVMENLETGKVHLEMTANYTNEELGDCTIYNKDIKSIVTKEQFESLKYEV